MIDTPAWDALRDEVRRFVVRRAGAADVDDLVQEVLVAIATSEQKPRRIGALAHGIARRTVADHHRRRAREHARLARLANEPEPEGDEPVSSVETALARALARFLDDITPSYAEAVRAVDVEGQSQAEVARALGIPLSTLRTRVQRGRAELRAQVRRCCDIEQDRRGRVTACTPRASNVSCEC